MAAHHAALLAALAGAACRPPSRAPLTPAAATGAALLGYWEYVAPRPLPAQPSLNAGLRLAVEFDSAAGARFSGRVALWFAGDMGLGPGVFGRVEGEVTPAGAASFAIPFVRTNAPPLIVSGIVRGDTLAITSARRGVEPGPLSTAAGSAFVRRPAERR
jgi:hypothetical protein